MEELISKNEILAIDQSIYSRLFDHQIQGLLFLYKNFKTKDGCVLADDMGLGKTVQIAVYLTSLKFQGLLNKALILVPATLMDYWLNEVHRWIPKDKKVKVVVVHGTPKQRQQDIKEIAQKKCIVISSHSSLCMDLELMQKSFLWDVMVVDEGHRAKNVTTKFRKAIKEFRVTRQKVILTGTPVQNNLEEFFSIFDLVQDGCFGTLADFKRDCSNPIKKGL
jgi:SNF2 family DNA or RNA helicase